MTRNPKASASSARSASSHAGSSGDDSDDDKRRVKKPKKLPACDSCKFRRVLCHPRPVPESCPRCLDKKIVCTTTPVVRKKAAPRTGKRIEAARAVFGTIDDSQASQANSERALTHSPTASITSDHSAPPHPIAPPPIALPTVSPTNREALLGLSEVSSQLAAHLLELFALAPDCFFPFPLLTRGRLLSLFQSSGRSLSALSPEIEVLCSIILAFSARFSSHPLIIGRGAPAPGDDDFFSPIGGKPEETMVDWSEFGTRREGICKALKARAQFLIGQRGTMILLSEENAASCHLMEVLEAREGYTAVAVSYNSAFISHIRALAGDLDESGRSKLSCTDIHWGPFVMQEVLSAQLSGRPAGFTKGDQLLMCGKPKAVERVLLESTAGVDIRQLMLLLYYPMHSFMYYMAEAARESAEFITGAYARQHPLEEMRLTRIVDSLPPLRALLQVVLQRLQDQLTPAATTTYDCPPIAESERKYVVRTSTFTLPTAWAALVLPLYREVKRRVGLGGEAVEGRRGEVLRDLYGKLRDEVRDATRLVAQCMRTDIPSPAFLSHLQYFAVEEWATVAAGADLRYRPEDQILDLSTFIAGMKRAAFSWTHYRPIIEPLEERLNALKLDHILNGPTPAPVDLKAPTSRAPLTTPQPAFAAAFSSNIPLFTSGLAGESPSLALSNAEGSLVQMDEEFGTTGGWGDRKEGEDVYGSASAVGWS